ncbi:MAG TPA: M3 family oligoendopeptidase [Candidatus Dormibacteraeota bacterium]|nr:M3 family oligoendopeptidase [Candidatus Dormibacteraeota bacterium]
MSARRLPESPGAFADAAWADIRPYFEELAERPLGTDNVEEWLADWSALDSMLSEAAALANFAYTCDTADPAREAAQLRFGTQIGPRAHEQRARLQARLVELGYVREGLETTVQRFRNQAELFREQNVPLLAELSRLLTEWSKTNGALTVDWDGQEKTPAQLLPFLESPDRATRERAFKLRAEPYLRTRDRLAELFDQMLELRQQVARNAGFESYRDFAHREKNRFDYTVEDCLRFHAAVEEAMLPVIARMRDRRRSRMKLDRLRPWDLDVDPDGLPALRPFENVDEFVNRTATVLGGVDADYRGYLLAMADAGLLDLANRKGKAPGGYSATLHFRKMPLIFMNAVGIGGDVRTLLHEAGHAFHSFDSVKLPLIYQRHPGSEMAEVASMSMELLASPFVGADDGGYFSAEDAKRWRAELLEGTILFFPHCASVDAFQQWIYTDPRGREADARDAKWLELRGRFEVDTVDWSGLDRERVARWYQQPHFFSSPFYYIEYGIAQLGALQVWRNSLRDPREAVRRYREALALGGTKRLPELLAAAGARLIFDAKGMREIAEAVEEELAKL